MGQGQRSNDRRSVAERREQLVDAALEVLANQGLVGTTTRAVTDHAGLALGAFHYAFESKDELLRAVLARRAEEIESAAREAATGAASVAEIIDRLTDVAWGLVEGRRSLALALYELMLHALRNPELASVANQAYERAVTVVADAVRSLPDRPAGSDPDDLARFVVATIDGLILQDLVHGDPAAAKRRQVMYTAALMPLATTG